MDVLFGLSILASFFLASAIGCFIDGVNPIAAGSSGAVGMFMAWVISIFSLGAYRAFKQPRRLRYHFPSTFGRMRDSELENGPLPVEEDPLSIRRSIGIALLWLGFRVGG